MSPSRFPLFHSCPTLTSPTPKMAAGSYHRDGSLEEPPLGLCGRRLARRRPFGAAREPGALRLREDGGGGECARGALRRQRAELQAGGVFRGF